MKRNLLLLIFTALCMCMNAQAPDFSTGTAKRTGDIDVNWVQLWENGPKFAEYNVGATSETENGGYYCWGGKIDKNTEFDGIYAYKEFTSEHDTAINLWGSNWRMPTKEEFEALYQNCDYKYISDYKGSGINVGQFTGKGDYAANSIVIPLAGYYMPSKNDFWTPNTQGWYWTSSHTRFVDQMCINKSHLYLGTADDSDVAQGCSVRAVLVEKEATNKTYQVYLESYGPNKLKVIQALKEALGISLKEAKDLADAAPCIVLDNATKEKADALAAALRALGATVTVKVLYEEDITDPEDATGNFQVILESVDSNKIAVIKVLKEYFGIGNAEALKLINDAPSIVLSTTSSKEANALAAALRAAGATVTVKNLDEEDITTGIVGTTSSTQQPALYDLQGRQLGTTHFGRARGLYISKGTKVLKR